MKGGVLRALVKSLVKGVGAFECGVGMLGRGCNYCTVVYCRVGGAKNFGPGGDTIPTQAHEAC